MKKYITLIIVGAVVLLLCGGACSNYNGMVEKEQVVEQTWAQVENQYQRRADLIPNLVNTVKGYAAHESTTLQSVTDARAGLSQAYNDANAVTGAEAQSSQEGLEKFQQAQSNLKGALDIYVNAVREAYPDLKANSNFQDLQTQLEGTENRISTERQRYTEAVKVYNTKIKKFPGNIFAAIFGFDAKPQFKAEAGAEKAPVVQF